MGQRKQFTAGFKAKVALEAIKGQRTAQEIGSIYGVHPTQVTTWKRQLVAEAADIFTRGGVHDNEAIEQEKAELVMKDTVVWRASYRKLVLRYGVLNTL